MDTVASLTTKQNAAVVVVMFLLGHPSSHLRYFRLSSSLGDSSSESEFLISVSILTVCFGANSMSHDANTFNVSGEMMSGWLFVKAGTATCRLPVAD